MSLRFFLKTVAFYLFFFIFTIFIAYDSEEEIKKEVFDLSALPTAPRASRSAVDPKSLPSGPPYTAFLGNLSYDVEEDDIIEFFGNLKVCFPQSVFKTIQESFLANNRDLKVPVSVSVHCFVHI